MSSKETIGIGPRELSPGQWFYANHGRSEKTDTRCRLNSRKRAKDEYEIETFSIEQPWDAFNQDRQTKMKNEKAVLLWTGSGGELWWRYYYPGWRNLCHPGSKFRKTVEQIHFLPQNEAQQWETARKSSKWYFKMAHFFGCFADQKSSAQKFIQQQTLPPPGPPVYEAWEKGETDEEVFHV